MKPKELTHSVLIGRAATLKLKYMALTFARMGTSWLKILCY